VSCIHNWLRGSRSFVRGCRTLPGMPKVLTDLPDDVVALLSTGHGLFSAQAARMVGISNDRLRRPIAVGLLTRVWHGCYMATIEHRELSPWTDMLRRLGPWPSLLRVRA
jgi:hypothetical protein